MSEFAPRHEALPEGHEVELLPAHATPETINEGKLAEQQAELGANAHAVLEQAPSSNETAALFKEASSNEANAQQAPSFVMDHASKAITAARELFTIQRKLSPTQRAASKVIHQPVVRVASEVAGSTVTRASGLLGGGILAFVGSTGYFYLAKHMGFQYNASVFLVLFVGGFTIGLVIELLAHVVINAHRGVKAPSV